MITLTDISENIGEDLHEYRFRYISSYKGLMEEMITYINEGISYTVLGEEVKDVREYLCGDNEDLDVDDLDDLDDLYCFHIITNHIDSRILKYMSIYKVEKDV